MLVLIQDPQYRIHGPILLPGRRDISSTQVIPLSRGCGSVLPMHLAAGTLTGVALDNGSALAVLRNLGIRQFSSEEFYTTGTGVGILAADFNGYGLSDLLMTRFNPLYSSGGGSPAFTVSCNQPFTLNAVLQPAVSGAPAPTVAVSFARHKRRPWSYLPHAGAPIRYPGTGPSAVHGLVAGVQAWAAARLTRGGSARLARHAVCQCALRTDPCGTRPGTNSPASTRAVPGGVSRK